MSVRVRANVVSILDSLIPSASPKFVALLKNISTSFKVIESPDVGFAANVIVPEAFAPVASYVTSFCIKVSTLPISFSAS